MVHCRSNCEVCQWFGGTHPHPRFTGTTLLALRHAPPYAGSPLRQVWQDRTIQGIDATPRTWEADDRQAPSTSGTLPLAPSCLVGADGWEKPCTQGPLSTRRTLFSNPTRSGRRRRHGCRKSRLNHAWRAQPATHGCPDCAISSSVSTTCTHHAAANDAPPSIGAAAAKSVLAGCPVERNHRHTQGARTMVS